MIDSTLEKLRSLNYLNDESFAQNWALGRAQGRSYGPRRIEQELRSKGVRREIVREALGRAFEAVDETSRARGLLERYYKNKNLADPKTARSAAAFLLRRGYGSKVILNLLRYSMEEDRES